MNPTDPDTQSGPEPIGEPDDFKAMMIGAGLIFVVAMIPFSFVLCCLPQIAGAMLALHLFTKQYRLTLMYGDAIKLGILTAMLGALAAWVVAMALYMLFHYQPGAKEIKEWMLQFYTKYMPQAVDAIKEAMAKQEAQGMTVAQLLMGACGTVVSACIAGLIGGALGAAFFKRGPKPQ